MITIYVFLKKQWDEGEDMNHTYDGLTRRINTYGCGEAVIENIRLSILPLILQASRE